MNELKDKIESNIITKTFHISGMPLTVWKDLDRFCKEEYGDVRWSMVQDLVRSVQRDYKYELLFDEIQALKAKVAELEKKEDNPRKNSIPVFGRKE